MYRILIENEELEIKYNGKKLNYKYPKILKAFNYKDIEENKKYKRNNLEEKYKFQIW